MTAPVGSLAVTWRLLTNRTVDTLEQATELIDWYRAKKPIPKRISARNTFVRLIAQRGGLLRRKHDGDAATRTRGQGLPEVAVSVEGLRCVRSHAED